MHDFDVIIVGGGPTGFVTALGLAQAGVTVCVLEAEEAIIDSPRAAVYHWSVLDGLERLGIRAEAERIGFAKQDYLWLVRSTGEEIRYDLSVLEGHTAFPYNLHLGQDRLAAIARDRLEALPDAEVRFGTAMATLAQDAGGVRVAVEGPEGVEYLSCAYLVGADGAGSLVRKTLNLGFDGMTWPERFVATNVYHDFESAGYGRTTMVIDDQWGAVIVKIDENGLWRCTYMEDAALPERDYLQRLPDAYKHLLAGEGGHRLDRAAPYRMHQRAAESFRKGRVVLVGDAAHVTNPTGGYGLTTGLFDAYALWPTLAAVVLDGANPALLDIYAEERRRIYLERTSPRAIANKQLVFHACGGGAALENALDGLRLMARDADARRNGLWFVKTLETPSPVEA
ncbi:FAD-dependent monooxygenase [Altererythrobacter sp. CC-YST694]|uniref:FAD-dependent oxidoreductase n=1 Tax=Altererythrobacter sp. CC-YST694 TaxID=2755038 RepID=UPI001D031EF6|nr:FAD-dependent monooxygenase [Altererythrobacter sp. CC-YST694]MCB5425483.1 FAD-dependent monooxygenase [Altererythrobacter sp. CC-YST694]